MGESGLSLPDIEGTDLSSGYYRTLNDSKLFSVPWPNDHVYRRNGKKASFDTLSVPEFVAGYCSIILSFLPIMKETHAAIDHSDYLIDTMYDTKGGEWDLVRISHSQILHMFEEGKLRCENVSARDAQRNKLVQRAEWAEALRRGYRQQGGSSAVASIPSGPPCALFQSGRCGFASHHNRNGQQWVNICATCLRVRGQHNQHPDSECMRRMACDNRVNKYGGHGQGAQGRQGEA